MDKLTEKDFINFIHKHNIRYEKVFNKGTTDIMIYLNEIDNLKFEEFISPFKSKDLILTSNKYGMFTIYFMRDICVFLDVDMFQIFEDAF